MDIKKSEIREFEILGSKVRFKSQFGEQIDAEKVVDLFNREANHIKKQHPSLDNGQIALLVSLKIAADKLTLENEFKENVKKAKSTALETLHLIEAVSPLTF